MAKKRKDARGFVFSTDPNFKFEEDKIEQATLAPQEQKLKVYRDKKQRGGKGVTIVEGFVGTEEDLQALGKALKTTCGTGGSVKDGLAMVQGDQRQKVCDYLSKHGYRFKQAGG